MLRVSFRPKHLVISGLKKFPYPRLALFVYNTPEALLSKKYLRLLRPWCFSTSSFPSTFSPPPNPGDISSHLSQRRLLTFYIAFFSAWPRSIYTHPTASGTVPPRSRWLLISFHYIKNNNKYSPLFAPPLPLPPPFSSSLPPRSPLQPLAGSLSLGSPSSRLLSGYRSVTPILQSVVVFSLNNRQTCLAL